MKIKLHPSVASRNGLLAATALLVWHSCGEDTISTNAQMGGLRSRIPITDTVSVTHDGRQISEVKVLGRDQGPLWVEAEFPPGKRWRVEPSSYYAATGGRVVGLSGDNLVLLFNESLPVGGPVGPSPDRETNGIYLDWSTAFGDEATGVETARVKPGAQITQLLAGPDGMRIDVKTYSGLAGSLTLSANLRLLGVELAGQRVPIFVQPSRFSQPGPVGGDLSSSFIRGDTNAATVWQFIPTGNADRCVAKAYLNDSEVIWIGPEKAKWACAGGELWGVACTDNKGVLFRKATPSEQIDAALNGEPINASNIRATEARFFGGYVVAADKIGNVGNLNLQGFQAAGSALTATISGDGPFKGEIAFDPQSHAATFKAGRGAIGMASWHTIGPATNVTAEPWIGK